MAGHPASMMSLNQSRRIAGGLAAAIILFVSASSAQDQNYGVPLAPGETIIGVISAPSIVQIPAAPSVVYETQPIELLPAAPYEIDRATGLPRNQPGWTGDDEEPAAIACFPRGVCAHLND